MQRDEVVFIVESPFPYYGGGREIWLSAVADRLIKKYDVRIIVAGMDLTRDLATPLKDYRVKIDRMPPFRKALFGIPHYGDLLAYLLFTKYVALFLRIKLRHKKETIFFISLNPGLTYLTTFLMRKKNHRRICSIHGRWEMELGRLYPIFKKFFNILGRISYRDCHLIMPNGYFDIDFMKGIAKMDNFDEKVNILPAAVELGPFLSAKPDVFATDKKEKVITMCGTLSVIKGVPELIQSIPYIKKEYKGDFKIVFVGKGIKTEFQKMAEKLQIEDHVIFTGEKPRLELVQILQESDIVACNFGGGGLPASLLEAMAVGKPIVAWDNKMYNVVTTHGKTAYLVKQNDPEDLGRGIAYLLNNPEYAKQLGINAKKEAVNYDIDIMINRFQDILERCKSMHIV